MQLGESGLRAAHTLMSPAYHERDDALERFSMWFASPVYEALLGCQSWQVCGAVTTKEAPCETLLPDGRTFLGCRAVAQIISVRVKPGRPKWASSGASGSRVGQPLPETTFLWSVSEQADGSWTVDQIAPEVLSASELGDS